MKTIAIVWPHGDAVGEVRVSHGRLVSPQDGAFSLGREGCRLEITVSEENVGYGAFPTMVTVTTAKHPFTFLLRDVHARAPIWIPSYQVVVTEGDDARAYEEITAAVRTCHSQTALQRIESEPEESYARAAAVTRSLEAPTWLGLSRDMRLFEIAAGRDPQASVTVSARDHGEIISVPDTEHRATYHFAYGRGEGCVEALTERRLEDGVLPILHGLVDDEDVKYHFTTFASLERSPLTAETLRGTHFLVADGHGLGHMFTPEQQAEFDARNPEETNREEEVVLYYRVIATNTGQAPRYAWFQAPLIQWFQGGFDTSRGFRTLPDGRVFCVALLNGESMPKAEVAYLLQAGESVTFEMRLLHRPVDVERAEALASQDFAARHAGCRAFWQAKLAAAARFSVPEARVEEMIRAGLLHLDIVAYGLEPQGTVAATIGVYNPIGSESSPIIQYFDSAGWHDLARRSIQYFLDKQHDDGFIQNFGGYMLETGPALWTMGEHFRYTRDVEWVKAVKDKVLKSCDFILAWRERNKDVPRGEGRGLMEGKVADPEDPFHSFMLNGYGYLGLSRVSEMLADIDAEQAARLGLEAGRFKTDIREELAANLAKSPVVPLGDGTWCPSVGPWAEARGPVSLLTDGLPWWTHGAFACRDSLIGPLYLVLQEVLSPEEQAAEWMLQYSADLFHVRNVALSQPYYSEHALAHLRRGEVKAFLAAFYNGLSGLADRETYSFWEHYHHASPHKTHEEAWFLMQTRWMLYLEEGAALRLLPGVPRAWLEDGKRITISNAASYFGPFSLEVISEVDESRITARVTCTTDRKPKTVTLRLPHPDGRRAVRASGGDYDPAAETVRVEGFTGAAHVVLEFTN